MRETFWDAWQYDDEGGLASRDGGLGEVCAWLDELLGLDGEVVLMGHGSMTRWDGASSGFAGPWRRMADALRDPVLTDCEVDEVWEHDGALLVRGVHHDGQVELELRPMREEEAEALAWAMAGMDGAGVARIWDETPDAGVLKKAAIAKDRAA